MTMHVIEVGSRSAITSHEPRRRATVDRTLLEVIRWALSIVLLLLALCGAVGMAGLANTGTTPSQGPAPGFGL
jgi:hypothetical protein